MAFHFSSKLRRHKTLRLGCFAAALFLVARAVPALAQASADQDEPRWWGQSGGPPSVPYPYNFEPLDSWVYDEVDRQIAEGNLTDLYSLSRPLPRALLAARVAEALARGKRSLGLDRLARELAWEARMMDLNLPYRDTRPWISVGPRSSHVKFNGLISAGGAFEESEGPRFEDSQVGFRGMYWAPPGFGATGEYIVTQVEDARTFGNPVFEDTEIQFITPRYSISAHGRFWEVWAGRENNRWGPGRRGSLLVGGGTMGYGLLGYRLHVGSFATATAIHGWLSEPEDKYVAYHRIEMKLGSHVRLGLGEGVRYNSSSPEPLYVVNLVPYAAVERILFAQGSQGVDTDSLYRGNYISGGDIQWTPSPGWQLYAEGMLDDTKNDEPYRLAYQFGGIRVWEGRRRFALQAEYTRVYNYTYSVFYGKDFYHADEPMGYPYGPDLADLNLWADLDLNVEWGVGLRSFYRRAGEGNDIHRGPWCPDSPPETEAKFGVDCQNETNDVPGSGSTFAGVVENRIGLELSASYAPRDNLRLDVTAGITRIENAGHVSGDLETRPGGRVVAAWRW
jgi:hypothetical protein